MAEGVNNGKHFDGLVLGFGVNLNVSKDVLDKIDQPATSLNIEAGECIDKDVFLKKVLERFCLLYNRFIEEGFLLIREDYKKRAEFLNKEVAVKVFDKIYKGIAEDVTSNGALVLKSEEDKKQILYIGDIL